ncbi:MAG: hypothetical protein RLZZ546_2747 [Bacteroidota bacterium]|jgi:hypothetical protein
MEMIKSIEFVISNQILEVKVNKLMILKLSDNLIRLIRINNKLSCKILGINFDHGEIHTSIFSKAFIKDEESFGVDTVNFLKDNLIHYDITILYPAGYSRVSIEYILEKMNQQPIIMILDAKSYYNLFNDNSLVGEIYEYHLLERISEFKI